MRVNEGPSLVTAAGNRALPSSGRRSVMLRFAVRLGSGVVPATASSSARTFFARRSAFFARRATLSFSRAGEFGLRLARPVATFIRRAPRGCHGGPAASPSTSGKRSRTRYVPPLSSTSMADRPGKASSSR